MVNVVDICIGQRVVIEFLTAEGSSPIEIHRCLRSVYGEDAIDVSLVRCWVCCCTSSEKDIGDRPRRGRLATAVTTKNKDKVDVLIWDDCHIMTSELCTAMRIEKPVVMAIIRQLGYSKVHTRWVPKCSPFNTKPVQNFFSTVRIQRCFSVKNNYWW
jgi:hypothetical protein